MTTILFLWTTVFSPLTFFFLLFQEYQHIFHYHSFIFLFRPLYKLKIDFFFFSINIFFRLLFCSGTETLSSHYSFFSLPATSFSTLRERKRERERGARGRRNEGGIFHFSKRPQNENLSLIFNNIRLTGHIILLERTAILLYVQPRTFMSLAAAPPQPLPPPLPPTEKIDIAHTGAKEVSQAWVIVMLGKFRSWCLGEGRIRTRHKN